MLKEITAEKPGELEAFLAGLEAPDKNVEETVRSIIAEVREKGDSALIAFSEKFDGVRLSPESMEVSSAEIKAAYSKVSKAQVEALKLAKKNILAFAKRQLPKEWKTENAQGVVVGEIVRPLDVVGIYVPAGRYPLPSSVLMNALPAKAAGVKEIVMCTPPKKDGTNPLVLVAADIAGVDRIFTLGGSQAIAAMAFGTKTVPRVQKIAGPGNVFVATAKRLVFGQVSIDFVAGPSEVCVVADSKADAKIVAAELLTQAEHDSNSVCILVTPDRALAEKAKAALSVQLETAKNAETARRALETNSAVVIARDLQDCAGIVNQIGPEHLVLFGRAERLLPQISAAGSVFLGDFSPVAAGDYCSGTNHVLPTGGTAKQRAGLSARDFVKVIAFQKISEKGLKGLQKTIGAMADSEGLEAHKKSVEIRLDRGKSAPGSGFSGVDAIVLDIDGVLADVSNTYRIATVKAVEVLYGKRFPVQKTALFKRLGGFNNDWHVAYALSLVALLQKNGFRVSGEEFAPKIGLDKGFEGAERAARQIAGQKWESIAREYDREKIMDAFEELYLGERRFTEFFGKPARLGVKKGLCENEKMIVSRKTVEWLKNNGKKLGVITGRTFNEAMLCLERCGLAAAIAKENIFSDETASETGGKLKPNAAPLEWMKKRLNAEKVLYVGDMIDDLEMVKNAGGPLKGNFCAMVLTGAFSPGKKFYLEKGADAVLKDINELPKLFGKPEHAGSE
ncbi:MAG: histidinol dehydrogenase [Candidatus Diapherotrites archaeon]|nr:histidinol dehydrogenase [Candidatus Diapherotrites archaeon]